MWQQPDRHGVRLVRKKLSDFYDEIGVLDGPGYETEYFDEEGILAVCNRVLTAAGLARTV